MIISIARRGKLTRDETDPNFVNASNQTFEIWCVKVIYLGGFRYTPQRQRIYIQF